MKRDREEAELELARYLVLLSKFGKADHEILTNYRSPPPPPPPAGAGRLFSCKTCDKSFPSFQALGGHRASHKKSKLMESTGNFSKLPDSPSKPKTHRCSICGLEFPLGQALGGHMRRHRAAPPNNVDTASTASKDHESVAVTDQPPFLPALPVMKRSNSSKRVLSLDLSLALPMYQNDSELQMEKVTRPLLKCFI